MYGSPTYSFKLHYKESTKDSFSDYKKYIWLWNKFSWLRKIDSHNKN